ATALRRARLAEAVGAASAAIVAGLAALPLPARIQHLPFAAAPLPHDFGRVAVLTRRVLTLAGLARAYDVYLHAVLQVLLRDLGEIVVEDHDVVPLGLFLALAGVLVAPGLRRGNAHVDDRVAAAQPADFRVCPEIAHQNDLVDAASHDPSPLVLTEAFLRTPAPPCRLRQRAATRFPQPSCSFFVPSQPKAELVVSQFEI